MDEKDTFGQAIANARKRVGLSQKELANKIRKEDEQPITPQYLNDIEHDRRSPSSDHLVEQLSDLLKVDKDYLLKLAGKLPDDIRAAKVDEERFAKAMQLFRRELNVEPKKS